MRIVQISGPPVPLGRFASETRPPDVAMGPPVLFGGNQVSETGEIIERLNRVLKAIGRVFGTEIEVEESGDHLIFIDVDGEPVTLDGEELIAMSPQEIAAKAIGEVAARALRAGWIAKYAEIERARSEP
jgi:hypothetical protein